MHIWCPVILRPFTLRHFSKRWKIHFSKIYYFLIVCFFFMFWNFDVFLHMPIFVIRDYWLILGLLIFVKLLEFLKRSMVRGIRYLFIFQAKDLLNLCLNLNECQWICVYKRYPYKHKLFWYLITLDYSVTSQNANLFVMKNWSSFFPGS